MRFDSAEMFDPLKGSFSSTLPMTEPRAAHFASILPSGKVLLGGGDFNDPTAELFDPSTLSFSATGSMATSSRSVSGVALLSSGEVLVAQADKIKPA